MPKPLVPRRLTPLEQAGWDRDFRALCERYGLAAAYWVPIVEGDQFSRSFTGGDGPVCEYLDVLIREGTAAVAAKLPRR